MLRILANLIPFISLVYLVASAVSSPRAPATRCYITNSIEVCHNQSDESVFYDTPIDRVAYNVETILEGGMVFTVYHSEAKGLPAGSTGDAVRAGSYAGNYTFTMPRTAYAYWGNSTDKQSLLSRVGNVGGGGNPMTAAGLEDDPYYYIILIGVADDSKSRDTAGVDWRHYPVEGRTKDFRNFDIRTHSGWMPFTGIEEPAPLLDVAGNVIRSNCPTHYLNTQGYLGSISYVDGVYYYFYTDDAPGIDCTAPENLYYRTTGNLASGVWSTAQLILAGIGPFRGSLVRIAKARDLARWAVLYNCYINPQTGISNICLQFTQNMRVKGQGGVSDLDLSSGYYNLGIVGSHTKVFAQQDWLTDKWGNLASARATTDGGGDIYWSDFSQSNCVIRANAGCPVYGGKVWRAGWTLNTAPARKQ